jgi:hypothetical protein
MLLQVHAFAKKETREDNQGEKKCPPMGEEEEQAAQRTAEVRNRLIGCLYLNAQARVALADPIRQFSAYEWMQPNSYKMACFASAHTVCVSLVQATKQELS